MSPRNGYQPSGSTGTVQYSALDSQDAATAPDEAETDDELDTPGPLDATAAGTDAAAVERLSQQLVLQADDAQGPQHSRLAHHRSPAASADSNKLRDLWQDAEPLVLQYLVPAAVLLVGLRWLWGKLRGKGKKAERQAPPTPEPEEPEATMDVYASDFVLPAQTSSPRTAFLDGLRCVVAEHVAVQGAVMGCGLPSLWEQRPVASDHAPVMRKLVNLGASVIGQGSTQPCNYPTAGDNIRNPVGRFRVAGGGASGPAVAVATGEADIAVGSDFMGSLKLPAACMGLYAFVGTPCTLGSFEQHTGKGSDTAGEGMSSSRSSDSNGSLTGGSSWRSRSSSSGGASSSIETVGFIAAQLPQLCRVSSALGVPGAANLRHEVTQVVVAEDLFQLCELELSPGILAVKRAVLHWAGHEQAGSVQLMQFLEANTNNWRHLRLPEDSTSFGPKLPPVLRAITHAAKLLYHAELAQRYSEAVTQLDSLEGTQAQDADEQAQQRQEELDPVVAAALQAGAAVTQQELKIAQDIAKEVQDVLKGAVKKDVVVVIPCIAAAPPPLDAPAAAVQSWLERAHAFAAITALGGCPSLTLPVGQLADGAPLGLSLFGQSRTDQRLLAVADKLVPHVHTELAKLRQQAQAEAAAASAAAAAGANCSGAAGAKGKAAGKGATARRSQDTSTEVDPKRAERAERAKARGNEMFKAGKYLDAIKAYSEAIKLHPGNPVYFNNRAMAYLKVFSFEAAEADCNRALAAPTLAPSDKVKALLRRGTARMHKGDLRGAGADFREVLAAEPNNRQAREELKALQQQQQDMEDTRRQHALAAVAAAANGAQGGSPGFPPEFGDLDPATAVQLLNSSGLGPLGGMANASGFDPNAAGFDAGSAEQFAEMLRSGGMSVVLGQNGQAVSGPSGEPVIVGPDGQELTIEPSGQVRPYKARRSGA